MNLTMFGQCSHAMPGKFVDIKHLIQTKKHPTITHIHMNCLHSRMEHSRQTYTVYTRVYLVVSV